MMTDLNNYDYHLAHELIAQQPVKNRVDSRLMLVNRANDTIEHLHFRDLPELLHPGDAVVLNDTRVVPAKLVGYRDSTGGRWQGLFLEKDDQDVWKLLCKTRGKLVAGETIGLVDRHGRAAGKLRLLLKMENGEWVAKADSDETTLDLLQRIGRVPLPHYIRNGEALPSDMETYQTVFAEHPGSVAAPTAGLHFTKILLSQIAKLNVTIAHVTLHVGYGTFQPVKAEQLEDHTMHSEWCELTAETAEQLRKIKADGGRVTSVGTTCVRTLETAAADGELKPFRGKTDLFIRPPHHFNAVDSLITNLHLPRSTLLVLVQAFGGSELIRRAYENAIREKYRFFSYGDAMMII